jgi:hypothetical protein
MEDGTMDKFGCASTPGLIDEPEHHYIIVRTFIKPTLKEKLISLRYFCNIYLCNSFETFAQIKDLLNITSDASKLSWPSTKSTKLTTKKTTRSITTTNRHFSMSTTEEIILSNTKFTDSTIVNTTDTNMLFTQLNFITIANILNNTDNKLESTLAITNTYPNFSLETTTSKTRIIINNTNRLEIQMIFFFIYYFFLNFIAVIS